MNQQPASVPKETLEERRSREIVKAAARNLARGSGWMKFLAILTIISSITSLIFQWWTVFYLWITLWTAFLLFHSASLVGQAAEFGEATKLNEAMDRLRLYFKISGIVAVIGLLVGLFTLIVTAPWIG